MGRVWRWRGSESRLPGSLSCLHPMHAHSLLVYSSVLPPPSLSSTLETCTKGRAQDKQRSGNKVGGPPLVPEASLIYWDPTVSKKVSFERPCPFGNYLWVEQ